jgi:hypothetical protein
MEYQKKRDVLSAESTGAFTKEAAEYEPVSSRSPSVSVMGSGPFANYSAETEKSGAMGTVQQP